MFFWLAKTSYIHVGNPDSLRFFMFYIPDLALHYKKLLYSSSIGSVEESHCPTDNSTYVFFVVLTFLLT